jgi:tetratricopeptide (TPR) repeat protein
MSSHKVLLALVLLVSMPPYAGAQKGVMQDGHLAVRCDFDTQSKQGIATWTIEQVDVNGVTGFKIPVHPYGSGKRETLFISANRVILQSQKQQDAFDEDRAAVTWKVISWKQEPHSLELRTPHHKYYFTAAGPSSFMTVCCTLGAFPACSNLVEEAFADFPAAEKQFSKLTRSLPPAREAAWHDFQPKAAAWRALPVKPPLNAETDRHRILAENALKEKSMDSAIEHYESALDIQPTWPAGWFNLALLYAEQRNYADATDAMKHYLELVPDASDAQQARDQIVIWEDKAKH